MKRLNILIALLLFAAAAAGQSPGRGGPDFEKVLVYQPANSSAAEESLKGFDARLLHRYERSALISINRNALEAWSRKAKTLGVEIAPAGHFDRIFFQNGITDTRIGTAASHTGHLIRSGYPNGRDGVWVVQFIGPILPAWQEELKNAGATVFGYVPMNALLVVTNEAGARRIAKSAAVQYVDVYQPFLKFAQVPRTPGVERQYLIHLAKAPGVDADLDALKAWSATPLANDPDAIPGEVRVFARLEGTQIEDVLELPMVVGVSVPMGVSVSDERVALSLANDLEPSTGAPVLGNGYKAWLASICDYCDDLADTGFHAAIADQSGFDGGMSGTHAALPTSRIIWGANYLPSNHPLYSADRDDLSGHPTMVATIIAGDPVTATTDSGGFLWLSGVAPAAKVIVTTFEASPESHLPSSVTPISSMARDAYTKGGIVQNHSYNAYTLKWASSDPFTGGECPVYVDGEYTTMSHDYDQAVIDADDQTSGKQPLAMTVSAGNISGQELAKHGEACVPGPPEYIIATTPVETLPPATAKNVIAVGSGENVRPDNWGCRSDDADDFRNLSVDSKRGTAYTGAQVSSQIGFIKPDLVAPGANIVSLMSQSKTGTNKYCTTNPDPTNEPLARAGVGTSFAAPVVTGAAVLAARKYAEDVKGGGTPQPRAAKPSLIKAMLIAGAKSMQGGTDRKTGNTIGALPNKEQGFGRVVLDEVLADSPRVYVNESAPFTATNQEWTATYVAADPGKLVKIALVWSDPPASVPVSAQATPLVNDLDLIVEYGVPTCGRLVGNKLAVSGGDDEVSIPVGCSDATIDHANNVEVARFRRATGTFTVKVRAVTGSITSSSPQPFSLVIYNAEAPVTLTVPQGVTATASGATATISWTAVDDTDGYEIQQRVSNAGWIHAATVAASTTSTMHTPSTASGVVLYRVRAIRYDGTASAWSDADITYVKPFTNDPVAGNTVQAVDVIELREAANGLLTMMGQSAAFSGNDLVLTEVKKLVVDDSHFIALRDALNAGLGLAAQDQVSFAPAITPAFEVLIDDRHIEHLRNGLK